MIIEKTTFYVIWKSIKLIYVGDLQNNIPFFNSICDPFKTVYNLFHLEYNNTHTKAFLTSKTFLNFRSLNVLLSAMFSTLGCMKSSKYLNKDPKFIFALKVNRKFWKVSFHRILVEYFDQVVCMYKREGLHILPDQPKMHSKEEAFGYNESLRSLDIYVSQEF